MLRAIVFDRDRFCRAHNGNCPKLGGRGYGLQAAHIFPKGSHPSMRYRLDNVALVCQPFHYNILHLQKTSATEAARLLTEIVGEAHIAKLSLVARTPGKVDRVGDRLYLEAEMRRRGLLKLSP
jgi:hypothetical protein